MIVNDNNIKYKLAETGLCYAVIGLVDEKDTFEADTLEIQSVINGLPVTEISKRAFKKNNSLEEIIVPPTIVTIDSAAFTGCSMLRRISFEGDSQLTFINSYAFSECNSLSEIVFPENVHSIGDYAFWGCSSLEKCEIPDNCTLLGEGIFRDTPMLTEIRLPNNLLKISERMFSFSGIRTIYIPNKVTFIQQNAFYKCLNLEQVIFSGSIENIYDQAFCLCEKLKQMYIPETVKHLSPYFLNKDIKQNLRLFLGHKKNDLNINEDEFKEVHWDASYSFDTFTFEKDCREDECIL